MDNIETLLAAVAQTQGFDDDEPAVSTPVEVGLENSGQSPVIRRDTRVSQVIGEVFGDIGPSVVEDRVVSAPTQAFPPVERVIGDGVKRKRGRPPKGQVAARLPPPKRVKVEDEEEDVCFICFDGGSLVLCDRKGCPKAYHPACIKRDEAFFQSKAKWNCGWHICSVCLKASHYTCYTCTYSLCKGCTKDTDFVCVRRNNGFCSTCMKMIMLIENKDQATNASVDFDDQTSWEYLFKVYWVILKEKLSLTMNELMQAKNPWNGAPAVACKPQYSNMLHTAVGGECSTPYRSEHLELNKPHVGINSIQSDRLGTASSSNDNHVEKVNSAKGEHVPSYDELRTAPSSSDNHVKVNGDKGEHVPSYSEVTVKPITDKVADEPSIIKKTDEPPIKEATEEPCIAKTTDEPAIEEASEEPCTVKNQHFSSIVKDTDKPSTCKIESEKDKAGIHSSQWASKELLEFVAYMKNGDTSPVSQFDVQTLLLEYIKRNNLRDPRRKSQIICDLRLKNLFGKPRVGHIEMLKLLEFHSLIKEDSQKSSFIPAGIVSSVASDSNIDANTHALPTLTNSRKRKTRKRSDDRPPQNDLNEYAAIDLHNINLIYLRRNLMENLINDRENFKNKVIGSIVRIRISTNDQKPEVFRLVKVVGTSKVAEPYTVGDRTTDVMLEVLNLYKKEVISIDAISNLEFTEDECRRLRQSIRCGLVKQLSVGEVQKKALELQSVRVNDWLEAEVMRLNHLRDRASEKGRKKELREYVDRIELLKSPDERQRRISEVPEIHADPKMDPNYESEEDTGIGENSKRDERVTRSHSSYPRKGRKLVPPNKKAKEERSAEAQSRIIEKTEVSRSNGLDKHTSQINIEGPPSSGRNDQTPVSERCTATAATGSSPSSDNIETEKLWHYRDPNAKIQGPFAMVQLRKWSTTGLFPPDMRIWTNHEQYDSLLLTDALNGKLHGASDSSYKPALGSQENGPAGDNGGSEGTNGTSRVGKQTEPARCENVSVPSDKNTGLEKADQSGSSGWPQCWDLLKDSNSSANDVQEHNLLKDSNPSADAVQERNLLKDSNSGADDVQERNLLKDSNDDVQDRKLLKDSNSSADDVQERNLLPPSSSGERNGAFTNEARVNELNDSSQDGDKNSIQLTQNTVASGRALQNETSNEDRAGQPCEENLRSVKIDLSSNIMDSGPVSPPDLSKRPEIIELFDFPSPTPKAEIQQSVSPDVPVQDTCILELLSPTPRCNNEYQEGQAVENKQSGFTIFPTSGPGWPGGVQLPEVADEWCGFSPTPARPSIQEWDSGLVSASSSKPPEIMTENINTQAAANTPNWLTIMNEPIEFDALGEESVSDLLAEVDAMESRGALPSPTSAMKFARELMEDCKDDCFSSIEEFSPTTEPRRSDAFSSTTDLQLTSQSSAQCEPIRSSPVDAFDFFKRSSAHSSASSEGETNAPVHSGDAGSESHPPTPNNTGQDMTGPGLDATDPGWGQVQGNINLVTVQGNVNLVLGGPTQGMTNLGWGSNPGSGWVSPGVSRSPRNGNLPWDRDGQRKYGSSERFSSPRERGYQGRQPWGRQAYGGGGYPRPLPKGQKRVCKFYESGRCKKGAFCDYLHP